MSIVARAAAALNQLFGPLAIEANRTTGVVVRQRKFTPLSLARTFVLGFLQKADPSDEELACVAAVAGAAVTPQAIDQRQTPQLAAFLEDLFRRAVRVVVGSDRVSVHTFRQATTEGGETRPYRYLTSGATANGSLRRGNGLSFPYPPFEQAVLQALRVDAG